MNKNAACWYVERLMNGPDEDAFHSLIESPDEALAAINGVIQEADERQFERMVDVLRELRTADSFQVLRGLCERGYSEKWRIAAEGFFYANPTLATTLLMSHLNNPDGLGKNEKQLLIEEMASSVEGLLSEE